MGNKVEFEVEKDGVKTKLWAIKPDVKTQQRAQMYRAKKYKDFVKEGAFLETELKSVLVERKVWDDTKQKQLDEIDGRIEKGQKIVEGKDKEVNKTSQMRDAAIQLRIDRMLRVNLLSDFSALQNQTAETMANDERFNFLVANCVVYPDTKKTYFENVDEYLERANDPDAEACAGKYAAIYYGFDEDFDKKLPENVFLLKYGMCNDKLNLTNKEGKLIDYSGNLINKEGDKVDENGKVIEAKVEETVVLDDDWGKVEAKDVNIEIGANSILSTTTGTGIGIIGVKDVNIDDAAKKLFDESVEKLAVLVEKDGNKA